MIIDFSKLQEADIDGFKGGEGIMHSRAFWDGRNRIMLNRLEPGACSGYHAHTENCEMTYVLKGTLEYIDNGVKEVVSAGCLQYCPIGHSHSFRNIGSEPAEFLAIVPEQRI